jgi:hypothetical protein
MEEEEEEDDDGDGEEEEEDEDGSMALPCENWRLQGLPGARKAGRR